MKYLKKYLYMSVLMGAMTIGFSANLVAQTGTIPSTSLVSGTESVDGVEEMTHALADRLGLGDDEIVTQTQENIQNAAVAAVAVAPVFEERTIDHLDLSGQSTNDSDRKRVSLGDFNRDGVEDVIVARWNKGAQLLINNGGVLTLNDAAFASNNDVSNAKHIGIIDANADGWLDLIAHNKLLLNRGNNTGGMWLGFASGQTINGAESNPFTIRAADFDGDGDQDIVTTPGRIMLVNNGAGTFTAMPNRMDSNILLGVVKFDAQDFDGDGDIDLAGPTQAEDEHFVYYNDGFGSFTNALRFSLDLDTLSYVQVAADFNDDNIADFRIYADGNQPRAFMSTGTFTGGFPEYIRRIDQNLTGDNGKHGNAHIRDIDGDGDLDFILSSIELFENTTDILNEKTEIIINEGVNAGTFADFADPEWANEESYDAKIIDVNLDGNMDLLLAHRTRLAIYINNAQPQIIEITGHTNSPSEVNATTSMSVEFTGGSNPVFTWDMGDGSPVMATGSTPSVSHTYSIPGRHQVTVSVNDGQNADSLVFWHTAFVQKTASRPNASTTIVYETRDSNDRVWTVNPDHGTVSAVRIDNGTLLAEIVVGEKPNSLALGGDGRLFVINKNDATISIINTDTFTVESTFNQLPKAAQPHGLVFAPANNSQIAYVTLEATGQLAQIDFDSSLVEIMDLGPLPRELSISNDGSTVYVSRFITPPVSGESTRDVSTIGGGEVWVIDGPTMSVQDVIQLPYNDQLDQATSARGIPNYLMTPLISPSGLQAFVPANVSNIYRGQFRDGQNREHNMLVRSMLAKINLQTNTEEIDGRHDFDNSSQPTTGVFDPTGNYLYLVFQGSRKLRVFDIYAGISLDTLDLGFAPVGVTTSPDGKQVIAHNYLSRSIQVFDATSFVDGVSNQHVVLTEHATTGSEPLSATLLLGKRLFFDSSDERLSSQSYISCAACHADGGHDGRTWDFSDVGEGLRNTIDLRGRSGTGHGLVHWTANFDEIHDFENDIRDIFKGDGLMSDADFANTANTLGSPKAGLSGALDALAAFVSSLSTLGQSPYRQESGALTSEAVAGRQIFAQANCAACHGGQQFTDSVTGGRFHDIGTVDADTGGRLGSSLIDGGLDTPTLRGLWHGAPYLHDGSAATVENAVLAHTSQEVGFDVSSLSQADRDNLVAYLLQIDDHEQSAPSSNQVPVVTNPGNQTNTVGENVNLTIDATDDNGDPLNYSATGLPDGLTINSNSGAITGTVSTAGSFTVTVVVNDGNGGSDNASFSWVVHPSSQPVCTTYTSTDTPTVLPINTASITSFLSVPTAATITDVNVGIDMEHAWVGDVRVTLSHLETGTTVEIMDRPGSPPGTEEYGCDGDDIRVVLDDAASDPVENQCAATSPTIDGTFSPNNALSAFDGENASGTWSLRVHDDYLEDDGGTLTSWNVRICSDQGGSNQPPIITNPGPQNDQEGASISLGINATDADGDGLTYSATGLPDGLTINSNSGAITGTVSTAGSFTVTVVVNDGNGGSDNASFSWVVHPSSQPVCTTYTSTDTPTVLPINTASITSFLSVPTAATITDVNVGIDMEHAWVGDVRVTLSHLETGTTVEIMDRPGSPPGTEEYGCDGDDIRVVLDDAASDPVENQCAATSPTIDGTFSPNNALSAFDGENASGTWSLRVHDDYLEDDGGTLTSWNVRICSDQGGSNQPPIITNPGPQNDQEGASISLGINATDADGDGLTYSATGLPDGLAINSNTGEINGTLGVGSAGSYNVTITVSDGITVATASFTWVVTTAPSTGSVIYLSSTSGGTISGISFADEDILTFNTVTDVWATYFDGSDVGLSGDGGRDIDAFYVQDDGSILLSVLKPTTLPDIGSVDDSDIVRFVPSSLGTVTAGSFELYFDGSDVGLTLDGEDIDSVHVLANGDLVISTIGNISVPGVTGKDEDLIRFSPTSLGANTSGTWSMYFDGSDVGLATVNSEDISGTWIDENSGDIFLNTRGEVTTTDNVSGAGADILRCQPSSIGTNTNCSFDVFWPGSSFGYGNENIDGLYIDR